MFRPVANVGRTLRRWTQFRLWTLLLMTTAVAAVLGWRRYQQDVLAPVVPTFWDVATGENIKWVVPLGSQTYGPPVAAGDNVFVGTNNGHGYLARYPSTVDLGVLLCFRASDGAFLWQASSPKLPTGRVNDWPLQGLVSRPLVEGDRLWYVTNRCEVVCLDTNGFYDQQNDGPVQNETVAPDEADIIWKLDMFNTLGVRPHNMSTCSPAADATRLFIVTSNGVDESHVNIPAPGAPSFLALDKRTGKVLWTDNSPGANIMHGQWGSPVYAVLGGVPQVIFPGGDGWIYSFDPVGTPQGTSKLLWKFDINPKASLFVLGGRGTRNDVSVWVTIYEGRIYFTCGQDPEHGEGQGHVWCIDPTKRGDVSAELVYTAADHKTLAPARRVAAVDVAAGECVVPNPNSAVVWHYVQFDVNGDGKISFEETMHRSLSGVAIQDGIAVVSDFSGYVHCLDAANGTLLWSNDLFAACWCSPLVSGRHVYVGDEEGKMTVYALPLDRQKVSLSRAPVSEIDMLESIYCRPTAVNRVLYLVTKAHLYAITEGANYIKAAASAAGSSGAGS